MGVYTARSSWFGFDWDNGSLFALQILGRLSKRVGTSILQGMCSYHDAQIRELDMEGSCRADGGWGAQWAFGSKW